jgi:hypothetical protein
MLKKVLYIHSLVPNQELFIIQNAAVVTETQMLSEYNFHQ